MENKPINQILQQVKNGEISIEEAEHLIYNLFNCDHSHQKRVGNPLKRICQKCGEDRTSKTVW